MGQETRSFVRGESEVRPAKYAEHFYRRVPITKPSYETDAADLLPQPKKIGRVTVAMADAEKLRIASHDRSTARYEATELPTIQFKGKLAIAEVPDEEVVEEAVEEPGADERGEADTDEAEGVPEARLAKSPTEASGVQHLEIVHKKGRAPLNAYTKHERETLPPLSNPDGIIGMQRARITDRNPRTPTIKVDARLVDARPIVSPWVVVVSGALALVIAVGLMSVTNSVAVTAESTGQTYTLTPLAALIDLIRTQLQALLVHSF